MEKRAFVIGDIHGCYKTFASLLFDKLKIRKQDKIYLLGDYIDRGPSSKDVVDLIIKLIYNEYSVFPIMGNHEQMLVDSVHSFSEFESWKLNGSAFTLKSFGVNHPYRLKKYYLDFFRQLRYYYVTDDFIIVHGGLNFDVHNPLEDTFSMVWTRNKYVLNDKIGGRRLIVGHTPVSMKNIRKSLHTSKIMLDAGCVYLNRIPVMGFLCALELNTMKLSFVKNIDL